MFHILSRRIRPRVYKVRRLARHTSIEHTQSFLDFSDEEWERWPAGPYLIENGEDRRLLGSTGLNFEASGSGHDRLCASERSVGLRLRN